MKIDLGKMKEKVKGMISVKGKVSYRLGNNPDSDWLIVIWVFILITILIIGYTIYSMSVLSGGFSLDSANSVNFDKSRVFDEEKMREVIQFYEDRKESQKNGLVPDIVDPSI